MYSLSGPILLRGATHQTMELGPAATWSHPLEAGCGGHDRQSPAHRRSKSERRAKVQRVSEREVAQGRGRKTYRCRDRHVVRGRYMLASATMREVELRITILISGDNPTQVRMLTFSVHFGLLGIRSEPDIMCRNNRARSTGLSRSRSNASCPTTSRTSG